MEKLFLNECWTTMTFIKKSRWSKIILLLLSLAIVEKGWVSKSHSYAVIPVASAALVGAYELVGAATLAGTLILRACFNSPHSSADKALAGTIDQLSKHKNSEYHIYNQPNKDISDVINTVRSMHQLQGMNCVQALLTQNIPLPVPQSVPSFDIPKKETVGTGTPTDCVVCFTVAATPPEAVPTQALEEVRALSQRFVSNLSINWDTFAQDQSREAVQAFRAYVDQRGTALTKRFEAEAAGWVPGVVSNGHLLRLASTGSHKRSGGKNLANLVETQIMRERTELLFIHTNQDVYNRVRSVVNDFSQIAERMVYGNFAERLTALMLIDAFFMDGVTYGRELNNARLALYAHYYHQDGSICIQSLKNMEPARQIMLKYHGVQQSHHQHFLNQEACPQDLNPCKKIYKKVGRVNLKKMACSEVNQCYREMVLAFTTGDMAHVEQICNDYTKKKRSKLELQDVQILHEELQKIYATAVQHQDKLLRDKYGILHFNILEPYRDPIYTALSVSERVQLAQSPAVLEDFNNTLKLRQLYKNALHAAWNISPAVTPLVHQALYALIDINTISERIDKIHELVNNPKLDTSERCTIVNALFLPNGIIKDFSDYERVQSLQMPAEILNAEHDSARLLLNHLVHMERVCTDQFKDECAYAIEWIQHAMETSDKDIAQQYSALARDAWTWVCEGVRGKQHDEIREECPGEDKESWTCGTGSIKLQQHPIIENESLPKIEEKTLIGDCPPRKFEFLEPGGDNICVPNQNDNFLKPGQSNLPVQTMPSFEMNSKHRETVDDEFDSGNAENETYEAPTTNESHEELFGETYPETVPVAVREAACEDSVTEATGGAASVDEEMVKGNTQEKDKSKEAEEQQKNEKANPLAEIKYRKKVLDQMKMEDYHSFPLSVDGFGSEGEVSVLVGGDGITRTKVVIKGGFMGKEGVFEYIIENDGRSCNHRIFIPQSKK